MNKDAPNCYDCKWRRDISGDAHSECVHPKINPTDKLVCPLILACYGMRSGAMLRLNITADITGIKHGWFSWPLNFDPTWLETCDGFEPIESNTKP